MVYIASAKRNSERSANDFALGEAVCSDSVGNTPIFAEDRDLGVTVTCNHEICEDFE